MAVFTSQDDNSVGETISGSSGNPTVSVNQYLYADGSSHLLNYVRLEYAEVGIYANFDEQYGGGIWNCQFLHCGNPVAVEDDSDGYMHNVLFSQCDEPVVESADPDYPTYLRGENITADRIRKFISDDSYYVGFLTNCIFTAVTNTSGAFLNHSVVVGNGNGIYQITGAGNYYLASGSTNRNAGTTNIDPMMLADIQTKTTYPPIVCSNITFSVATNFSPSPQVQRDTDTPDLGYHYDPLDYIFSNVTLSATLTLTNGVAVGVCGSSSIYGCVINPQTGAKIISVGLPQTMNRIASCQNVQEQPLSAPESGFVLLNSGTDASRTFQFRFTDFSVGQGMRASLLLSGSGMGPFQTIAFQDCWLRGANLSGNAIPAYGNETIGLTNNLILRGNVGFAYNGGYSYAALFNSYNNLFQGGAFFATLQLGSQVISGWNVKDNLFYGAAQSIYTDTGGSSQLYISNNGFTAGTTNLLGGGNNKTNLTADYQTGSLGNYYYPTSGGNLSQLINAGSRTADVAGLYHFTTQTNQMVEGNSIVDIGYHYVATDAYGNPLDSNGDGIPDYIEDANGDGLADDGETNWAPKISITNPVNNAVFAAGSINITVQAAATGTISQVQFFEGTTSLGTATSAPYNVTWSGATAGNYALTAVALDNGLTFTSAVVNITITPVFETSTMTLWVKADALTGLANNASVSNWPDSSGSGNDLTQSASSRWPSYMTNAINGYPVVHFNPTNIDIYGNKQPQFLKTANGFMNNATGIEGLVVLRVTDDPPPGGVDDCWNDYPNGNLHYHPVKAC